jgi:hypothetical protein
MSEDDQRKYKKKKKKKKKHQLNGFKSKQKLFSIAAG